MENLTQSVDEEHAGQLESLQKSSGSVSHQISVRCCHCLFAADTLKLFLLYLLAFTFYWYANFSISSRRNTFLWYLEFFFLKEFHSISAQIVISLLIPPQL